MKNQPIFPIPETGDQIRPPMVYVNKNPIWEYKLIVRDLSADTLPDETELDRLGTEGWELAGILSDSNLVYFYFKRVKD